ncbi:MAG: alpha/beta fold hydrolase [Rhizobacter sp.]|nr:alpha/beta fold hydrolase [Burkholderiaceae bacterium]MCO5124537.1 alpha/beta fold hydrolase [Rhizobacter sp.]
MIEKFEVALPHGITLSCRAAGPRAAPLVIFLHGFPEAAFVWDAMLTRFGDRYRCVAPNLRGFEQSSAPAAVEAYRPKQLVADIEALVAHCNREAGRAERAPLAALVAHDWGGALAWNLAAQQPALLERLVIINSPHPATFLRELQHSPAQQAASAYMNFLCRDDAAELLAADDFARLWPFFSNRVERGSPAVAPDWLTDDVKEQYRSVWRAGLQGGLNYYRASPLRPPTSADDAIMTLSFPPEFVTVRVPTRVIWGERDVALPPALLDGLEVYVPQMRVVRVPDASHWIVHEQPALVAREIEAVLSS